MPALKDTVFFNELTTRESDNAKIYAGKLLEISDDVGCRQDLCANLFAGSG